MPAPSPSEIQHTLPYPTHTPAGTQLGLPKPLPESLSEWLALREGTGTPRTPSFLHGWGWSNATHRDLEMGCGERRPGAEVYKRQGGGKSHSPAQRSSFRRLSSLEREDRPITPGAVLSGLPPSPTCSHWRALPHSVWQSPFSRGLRACLSQDPGGRRGKDRRSAVPYPYIQSRVCRSGWEWQGR